MATNDDPAGAAAAALRRLGDDLAGAYPRAAHAGRIEQITQAAAGLAALVAELPAEEDREADFEARCLESYRAGGWRSPAEQHAHTHTDRAAAALATALEGKQP